MHDATTPVIHEPAEYEIPELDDDDHRIWLGQLLFSKGIASIEVSLSGGGDSGGIDDMLFYGADKNPLDGIKITSDLEELKIEVGATFGEKSFKDALEQLFYEDAEALGNYYDGNGGSVLLKYVVTEECMFTFDSEFAYYEPDEDEYDDEADYWADNADGAEVDDDGAQAELEDAEDSPTP